MIPPPPSLLQTGVMQRPDPAVGSGGLRGVGLEGAGGDGASWEACAAGTRPRGCPEVFGGAPRRLGVPQRCLGVPRGIWGCPLGFGSGLYFSPPPTPMTSPPSFGQGMARR